MLASARRSATRCPELVYLGRHAPRELLVESYRFIGENWIEWFPANVLLVGCVVVVHRAMPGGRRTAAC